MLKTISAALLAMLMLTGGALAAELDIVDPMVRAMLPNQPVAAAYMEIRNTGEEDDVLLSVSTPEAAGVEIHTSVMEDDVMRMRQVKGGVVIPAGGATVFEPGGLHLMLIDPSRRFAEGESVPIMLTFEKAGEITFEAPVRGAAYEPPMAMDHDMEGMHPMPSAK